jgi:hypothetical protein
MSYSDEPHVISEKQKSPRLFIVIGILGLFLVALAAVALYPRYQEFRRVNTPIGPEGGSLYIIRFEGERYAMEMARSEAMEFYLHVFIQPVRDTTAWHRENHQLRYRLDIDGFREWRLMEWNEERGAFGPSPEQFHPMGDYRFDLELLRQGRPVWEGTRWSYREGGGHGH